MILVVDDSVDNREIMVEALSFVGFRALSAEDGVEALALVRSQRPALVLMDLGLPRLSGIETTRRLKADPETRSIPVVAVSAFTGVELDRALAAGCCSALAKPLDLDKLVTEVRRWVGVQGDWPVA